MYVHQTAHEQKSHAHDGWVWLTGLGMRSRLCTRPVDRKWSSAYGYAVQSCTEMGVCLLCRCYRCTSSWTCVSPGGKVRENTLNREVFRRYSASISPCFLACFRYLSPRYRRFAPTDRRKTARKVSKQLLALSRCE